MAWLVVVPLKSVSLRVNEPEPEVFGGKPFRRGVPLITPVEVFRETLPGGKEPEVMLKVYGGIPPV